MRILIIGSNGQLGSEFKYLSKYHDETHFILVDKEELDITNSKDVFSYFKKNTFDAVINCAAFTDVDLSESKKVESNLLNNIAVGFLSDASKKYKKKFIHISTDYVYGNSDKKKIFNEEDTPSPIGVYGKTKLLGEEKILNSSYNNSIIIRTSWLYSEFGDNFVKKIIDLSNNHSIIKVVNDQFGSPTWARKLAEACIRILKHQNFGISKIYNFSSIGKITWYDFAIKILEYSKLDCKVQKVDSFEFNTLANRPNNSYMSKDKISKHFDIIPNVWSVDLKHMLNE